jgi:hypothetical protein
MLSKLSYMGMLTAAPIELRMGRAKNPEDAGSSQAALMSLLKSLGEKVPTEV